MSWQGVAACLHKASNVAMVFEMPLISEHTEPTRRRMIDRRIDNGS